MSWIDYTEKNRKFLICGLIVVCAAILLLSVRRNVASYDVFWHIQTGLDWIHSGLPPWTDHFSFTFAGQPITSPPYIFQVLLATLVDWFGFEPGIQLYKLLCFSLLTVLFLVFLKKLRVSTIVYLICLPTLVFLLQQRNMVRPELVSYCFSVAAIMLYYRYRNGLSTTGGLVIALLMLVWSNYHNPIVGYVIFAGLFLDIFIHLSQSRPPLKQWIKPLLLGLIILLTGFLNPSKTHPLISILSFSDWSEYIVEYFPTYTLQRRNPGFYMVLQIALVTFAGLILGRKAGLTLVFIILGYAGITINRMFTPAGIVILCIFAWTASEVRLHTLIDTFRPVPRLLSVSMVFSITGLMLWITIITAREFMTENLLTKAQYPYDMTEYMRSNKVVGNIFNQYKMGGFLINELSPDNKVYIDGRTNILYPVEFYQHYLDIQTSAKKFRSEANRYDISHVVLPNNAQTYDLMTQSKLFYLDYMSASHSLYSRGSANFPLTGILLSLPGCWKKMDTGTLASEWQSALFTLPKFSPLINFMGAVIAYTGAEKKVEYLYSLTGMENASDFELRFHAMQALEKQQFLLALDHLRHLKLLALQDSLAILTANLALGRKQDMEKEWRRILRFSFHMTRTPELERLGNLLSIYIQKWEASEATDKVTEKLTEAGIIPEADATYDPEAFDDTVFCPPEIRFPPKPGHLREPEAQPAQSRSPQPQAR